MPPEEGHGPSRRPASLQGPPGRNQDPYLPGRSRKGGNAGVVPVGSRDLVRHCHILPGLRRFRIVLGELTEAEEQETCCPAGQVRSAGTNGSQQYAGSVRAPLLCKANDGRCSPHGSFRPVAAGCPVRRTNIRAWRSRGGSLSQGRRVVSALLRPHRKSRKREMPRQYTAAQKTAAVGDVPGHGPVVPAGTDTGGVSPRPPVVFCWSDRVIGRLSSAASSSPPGRPSAL